MYKVKFGRVNVSGKIYEKDEPIEDELSECEVERLLKLGFIESETNEEGISDADTDASKNGDESDVPDNDTGSHENEDDVSGDETEIHEDELTEEDILKMNKDALKKLADEKNIDVNGLNANAIKEKLIAELFETPNTSL